MKVHMNVNALKETKEFDCFLELLYKNILSFWMKFQSQK